MEAGIDSVEHANLIEEQDLEYFVKHGTVLSDPNLQLFFDKETGFESRENWKQPWWREKVIRARELSARWIPAAIRAGVKVALAVDSTHGMLWKEPTYLVQIGASTRDALLAVTRTSAELLGMIDEVGTLEPGKYADVIAVRGDPLADITALKNVRMIMKGGRRLERELLPEV
jgi:imidazolonepropionase-like amidohydrolase